VEEKRPRHGSLAEKRKADAEERLWDPQARPRLRLLEALLFASSEPLDPATLANGCLMAFESRRR